MCHVRPAHGVVEVDATGQTVRAYDGPLRLIQPRYLVVVSRAGGGVLVADSQNNRILQLNAELKLERVLLSREDDELIDGPLQMCYIEERGVLLVANLGPRVQAFRVRV